MTTKVSGPAKDAFQKDIATALEEQKQDVFYHVYHRDIEGPGFSTITIAQPRRKRPE